MLPAQTKSYPPLACGWVLCTDLIQMCWITNKLWKTIKKNGTCSQSNAISASKRWNGKGFFLFVYFVLFIFVFVFCKSNIQFSEHAIVGLWAHFLTCNLLLRKKRCLTHTSKLFYCLVHLRLSLVQGMMYSRFAIKAIFIYLLLIAYHLMGPGVIQIVK